MNTAKHILKYWKDNTSIFRLCSNWWSWITGFVICNLWVIKIASNFCAVHMKSSDVLYVVSRFTPDFTASRVIRELKFITAGGSEFVFILNASLPYHMLATCAEALPRPNWELALYIIISGIMRLCVCLFLLLYGHELPLLKYGLHRNTQGFSTCSNCCTVK